jgi:hypothetical protein
MRESRYLVLCVLVSCVSLAYAQLPDETSGRVPELDAFHKPIYALWHDAWPAKDIGRLKQLLPDVEKAYTALAEAKLPGILRDKSGIWGEKLKLLEAAVGEYRKSVEANDDAGILKATENVHSYYEQMVRVVRPALKELDGFHQVLYLLHHYYMPEYQAEKIRASADSLVLKMGPLNSAALPKRLESKSEQFTKARRNLDEAVKEFAEAVRGKKGKAEIAKLENTLHARYQVLEKVFE